MLSPSPNQERQPGQPEMIKVLETMLADVRAGKVAGLGFIKVFSGGQIQSSVVGAASPAALALGTMILQNQIVAVATSKTSPIMRPL